ncbi:MAG TPA: LytTR family DNA-binding domain-containing protein [Lachnospiraceae bacterium]|nr:LytTR family DNA-binding domain-containing protein [Lachnospiraceae bacterium]
MIKIAVCDDEKNIADNICGRIRTYAARNVLDIEIDAFESAEALFEDNRQFDVYFMDIQMQELDGMSAAAMLRKKNRKAVIVFISAYIQYAAKGYQVNAVRYILKSQMDEEFDDCMDAVMKSLKKEEVLEIKQGTKRVLLDTADIAYIENEKRKVVIHMLNDGMLTYEIYAKITELAEQLHEMGFIYCHAAFLVNAKAIVGIKQNEFILSNGIHIPISRQKYAQAQKEYYFRKMPSHVFHH